MKVIEDIMSPTLCFCKVEDSLEEVALQMIKLNADFLPVLDNCSHVIGTVTRVSLSKAQDLTRGSDRKIPLKEIMSQKTVFVNSYDDEATALMTMRSNNVSHLPVVDSEKRLRGIISFVSIARRLITFRRQWKKI